MAVLPAVRFPKARILAMKVFTFYVKPRESFCRFARGTSLARRAGRGAIDLAFALRLRLGLGTRLCPFYVTPAGSAVLLVPGDGFAQALLEADLGLEA
ncbi:MAG TPA: hypothetical protein P5204_11970, partial [Kiritimatiellia bacterium]|nr:hypothetical protein [Kiritimatiellia bacterium]